MSRFLVVVVDISPPFLEVSKRRFTVVHGKLLSTAGSRGALEVGLGFIIDYEDRYSPS
jgi:hypothetical protein